MTVTESDDTVERFCSGHPFNYAMTGIEEISGNVKHSHDSLASAIEGVYGTDVSAKTGRVMNRLDNAADSRGLVRAIRTAGLDDVSDWSRRIDVESINTLSDEITEPGMAEAMQIIDTKLSSAFCSREKDASKVTSKKNRKNIYVPELINKAGEEGTVYMAKTVSSSDKVRMAWDVNDSNQVVVVDDYEKWERLLGWEKLKQFPHGKNKIREELGDTLSDDVLEIVAGEKNDAETSESNDNTTSRGRGTRTKPSEEVLNLARGSAHKLRKKMQSEKIANVFEDDETIGVHNISMLVLFPTTTELNMTDYWWIPGDRYPDGGTVAIANCNKGTFEYLNQYEQVWHVEDYLEQAADYEFETSEGPTTMNAASTESLVIHIMSEQTSEWMMEDEIIGNIPHALTEYVEEEVYHRRAPELPHPDDMVYAPITPEDVFWMRPELRHHNSPSDGDAVICYANVSVRDVGVANAISSDYRLYSRARLPEWDFDSVEMNILDDASHYMRLDDGGYEMLQTLGMLHDAGKKPFSESPQSRWS